MVEITHSLLLLRHSFSAHALFQDENGVVNDDEGDDDDDDFADMNREELLELWEVLRQLGWFSLLQDAFSGVMFSHVLAYVRTRYVAVGETIGDKLFLSLATVDES